MAEVVKVERRGGVVVSVTHEIGNVRIKWMRAKNGSLVEVSRGGIWARVRNAAQLEISREDFNLAVRQARAIFSGSSGDGDAAAGGRSGKNAGDAIASPAQLDLFEA